MKDITNRVEEALNQIRPFLEADQGGISLIEITHDMIAKVELHGACSTCSMSLMTLKAGVEESIKKMAPEIVEVRAINFI